MNAVDVRELFTGKFLWAAHRRSWFSPSAGGTSQPARAIYARCAWAASFRAPSGCSKQNARLARLEQLVNEGRVRLHIYAENKIFDANMSHADRFVWGIQIAVAKQLSDKLSDDNKRINAFKAKHGLAPQKPPYGYLFCRQNISYFSDIDLNCLNLISSIPNILLASSTMRWSSN